MNILVDDLPTSVEVDGREYLVNSDFRTNLMTIMAFEDPELTTFEKQIILLSNTYPKIPENVGEAARKAIWFLNCDEEPRQELNDNPMRLYSFSKDAQLIYAAFRHTHGVDLKTVEMHWWVFHALFMDLGSDTAFSNLVQLRKRVKNGTATTEEREVAREMGDAFDVPDLDTRTLEEREAEDVFMRSLGSKVR